MKTLRGSVFSPSGECVSVRIVARPSVREAEDELFEWFSGEFTVGCGCAVDLVDENGGLVEQLHDWGL